MMCYKNPGYELTEVHRAFTGLGLSRSPTSSSMIARNTTDHDSS